MPRYRFSVYDLSGALTTGTIEAGSRDAALDALHGRGQLPVDLVEDAGGGEAARWWQREIVLGSGALPLSSLGLFTRELATLVKADVTVDRALAIVGQQPMMPRRMRASAAALLDAVREGRSLSAAMAARSPEFPEHYWRLVEAGEASGSLGAVLDRLAQFLERSGETRSQVTSALLYPAVLLAAALAAIGVIFGVLVPTITPLFSDAGAPLPPALRFLVGLKDFVSAHGLEIAVVLALIATAVVAALRSPRLRLGLDRRVLRLPVVGELVTARETARFARTLAMLSENGVPLLEALRIAGNVVQSRAFSAAIGGASHGVQDGRKLSQSLHEQRVVPDLCISLLEVGERTGQVEPMLVKTAEAYETLLQRRLARLMSLLTPMLTLVIGGLVGALILSVMNAILSINDLPGL